MPIGKATPGHFRSLNPNPAKTKLRFSTKKFAYLKYASIPIFKTTEIAIKARRTDLEVELFMTSTR